jgi:hypothetical protein
MKYALKSFTVAGKGTEEYADNWEQTFRRGPEPTCAELPAPAAALALCLNCGAAMDAEGYCAVRCFLSYVSA